MESLAVCIANDDLQGLQQLKVENIHDIKIKESFPESYSQWDSWLDEFVTREYTCDKYSTPFQVACQRNSLNIAKWLLESGASVEGTVECSEDKYKLTAAHLAASSGAVEIVKLLVGISKELFSVRTDSGWLPLHYAVLNDKIEVVNYLLTLNESYCTSDTRINFDKDFTCAHRGQSSSYKIVNNNTPLHFVRSTPMVELLIQNKANVNAVAGEYDLTPLHTAFSAEVAMALLKNGADPTIKSTRGETPIQYCYKDEIKTVLENWNKNV